uniref:ABC transporter domain-containing protein n=1 Tax=Spermophilus dauricus TaxID=99837 RepID=A0A8C9PCD6_SPEDA
MWLFCRWARVRVHGVGVPCWVRAWRWKLKVVVGGQMGPHRQEGEAPPGLSPGVSVRGLKKHFPGCPQPALRGLNLDFYQDQITAFLGHNGAGKTTTLSILSGLFPPSGGSAFVLGHDVQSSMEAIRPHLGVCPQYNVLFDMYVLECLWVGWAGFRTPWWPSPLSPQADRGGASVVLRAAQGLECHGGMQRKLSVALAFVGHTRVVILDEPTAGVDPTSRRGIWELLLKYREGRTLILSTHHLDEAELLGDRVAMVAGGRLCCCGSPLFLRHPLGCEAHREVCSSQGCPVRSCRPAAGQSRHSCTRPPSSSPCPARLTSCSPASTSLWASTAAWLPSCWSSSRTRLGSAGWGWGWAAVWPQLPTCWGCLFLPPSRS